MPEPVPGRLRLLLVTALTVLAPVATAGDLPDEPGIPTLDTVVVVASRAAEPLSQVVASVAQVDREQLDRYLVRDPESLVRYVPGVAITSEPERFGTRGFAIRGLEGNRVRVLVDGIPLADAYSVGQFSSAGRDLVDLEAIERVEIQRGPASTLYGSDALAGVVAFRTLDPEDLLARTGNTHYLGARAGFDGLDDSTLLGASWAGDLGAGWQAMALAARRSGDEAGNRAWRAEDAPNPVDFTRDSALAKLVHDAGAGGRYTLAFDGARESRRTAVNSMRFGAGRYATTYRLDGDDEQQRWRASLGGEWQPGLRWLGALDAQLYWQQTDVRQDTAQYRLPDAATPFESLRWRRFDYDARAVGLGVVGQSRHEGARHWQVFGVDIALQRYEGLRDGIETNLATGATSTVILGEPMPVRDFPSSDADTLALFWQDEISIGERFAVIPGLRAEWYRLRPHPDAIYLEDFPDSNPADVDENQVTPRLGMRWSLGAGHSLFAQYARGFRAPPFGDVNIGLLLPVFNYEIRANPDLRPERSEGLELGWRHVGDDLRASISIYENRYTDLIESRANLGIDPTTRALVFQSINRDRARIRGVEGDLLWHLPGDPASAGGWSLRGAFAVSRGDDTRRDRPLNTIDPPRATLGLRWEPGSGTWGVEGAMVAVRGKRESRIDHGDGELFAPPGYARFDLYAWAEPWQGVRINAGLLNLADRRYWDWGGVRGVDAGDENIGFYTRAGRSAAVNLSLEW